ncbi:MAG: CHASE2 domain-containing protein [Bacteriovoracaceae bacterium]|nr:CHASE2 domain-containing protein [Bacteriovoracaceae bacterium]
MKEKTNKSFDFSKYYPLFFTVVFVIILFQYSFSTLEAIFYDIRVKYDIGISYNSDIILIVMDEESDEFLGETFPYTYASHYHLFERMAQDRPRVVNYFVNLPEPESKLDKENSTRFKGSISSFISGGGIFRFGTDMDSWGERLPPEALRSFGYSLSLINVDNAAFAKDDVARRAVLNFSGEDSLHLWTANEYRKFLGLKEIPAKNYPGSYYLREADATFALFRYYTSPLEKNNRITRIPFHSVRVGNFPEGFFKDKIVLVGPSYISNTSDYVLSPFDKENFRSSKLTLHAIIIQALIQGKTVYQLPRTFTYALCIIIAVFLSFMISWLKPTHGLLITVGVMLGSLLLSYLLFVLTGTWLYVTHLVLAVFVVYYIWVPFRAIGEYQRRFAIQEETKLLKKVENLKQNFISLMSHDLKTPVAKIAGLADNMLTQRQFSTNDGERNLRSIVDSTKELNSFITSILDLTKIESRNLTLNMNSKDINTTVENVVSNLRFEANSKNVSVNLSLSPLYPIQYDPNLMNRVLSNLIENAIKYSGDGSTVDVETFDDEKWVYIRIKDNGVGIPASDIENIFEKFYRVKNDASHSIKGTGLGLYLVKYFVELHGGAINVASDLGQGTEFQIKLKNE